ncbi:hypothetical protein Sjap_015338 [Stephania japonica]|uniref:Uncharacterized protein n=1 Tax=Stephania japonica TaxID=461633 RepID=A0AAP0IIX7_9MAGN
MEGSHLGKARIAAIGRVWNATTRLDMLSSTLGAKPGLGVESHRLGVAGPCCWTKWLVTLTSTGILMETNKITPRWPPIPTIIVNSKTRTVKVEVCGLCGDYTHPTDVCPYKPKYESYPYWGNASPQPDLSYPFSNPLTPRQDEQSLEDMFKEYSSANQRMLEEEEFPVLLSCDEKETLNDVTLKSVETNEHAMNEYFAIDGLTPCIYEYWSDHEELEGELEVSQSEPETVMAQTYEKEVEKEIEVTLTRQEKLQQESKDDQSFVLIDDHDMPLNLDLVLWNHRLRSYNVGKCALNKTNKVEVNKGLGDEGEGFPKLGNLEIFGFLHTAGWTIQPARKISHTNLHYLQWSKEKNHFESLQRKSPSIGSLPLLVSALSAPILALQISAPVLVWTTDRGCSSLAASYRSINLRKGALRLRRVGETGICLEVHVEARRMHFGQSGIADWAEVGDVFNNVVGVAKLADWEQQATRLPRDSGPPQLSNLLSK